MIVSEYMKQKYPYLEKIARQEENERMIEMAETRLSQFVDSKMQEIDKKVNEVIASANNATISINESLNGNIMSNSTINREIKKMVLDDLKRQFK